MALKLDRLSDITSELSANLVKSIVLPGGLLEWLSKSERLLDRFRPAPKTGEAADLSRAAATLGPTVLLGGAPVPDEAVVAVLHLAGGRSARMAVIPVAASTPDPAIDAGVRMFTRFGMRNVEFLDLTTKERADSPEWVANLAAYDGVLLCGDDVTLGLQVLKDSAAVGALRKMAAAGKPIVGLEAGAAILAESLILEKDGNAVLTEGLGLLPGLLVETGFSRHGGLFSHMIKVLSGDPPSPLLGVGLDDGSAVVIRDSEARILGDGNVTVMDLRDSTPATDGSTVPPGSVCGLKVHVLTDGFMLNLRTRRPMAPTKEQPRAAGDR